MARNFLIAELRISTDLPAYLRSEEDLAMGPTRRVARLLIVMRFFYPNTRAETNYLSKLPRESCALEIDAFLNYVKMFFLFEGARESRRNSKHHVPSMPNGRQSDAQYQRISKDIEGYRRISEGAQEYPHRLVCALSYRLQSVSLLAERLPPTNRSLSSVISYHKFVACVLQACTLCNAQIIRLALTLARNTFG